MAKTHFLAGLAAAVTGAICLALYIQTPPPSVDGIRSYKALVDSFEAVAFENADGAIRPDNRLWKWLGPVTYSLSGAVTDRHRDILTRHFDELARLTGLTFQNGQGSARMRILFSRDTGEIRTWATANESGEKTLEFFQSVNCGVHIQADEYDMVQNALIVITELDDPHLLNRCIVEETTQALGLLNDGAVYLPAIFSEDDTAANLTINDKILVRTFYDREIRPGMDRTTAMPIARRLIHGFMRAAQTDEAALAHR